MCIFKVFLRGPSERKVTDRDASLVIANAQEFDMAYYLESSRGAAAEVRFEDIRRNPHKRIQTITEKARNVELKFMISA